MLIILASAFTVFAESAEVYADTVTAKLSETVIVPIKIKNNLGIMGFRITVAYDKEILSSPQITSGTVTRNGMINDSIGVTPEGKFDVVWSSTQNVNDDGTLFILTFTALKKSETKIVLSHSQADTFNEDWEDVVLNCSDITVNIIDEKNLVTEKETEALSESEATEHQTETSEKPVNEQIKDAVDIVLKEEQKESINDISEEENQKFVDRTNEILNQLNGTEEKYFNDIESLEDSYEAAVKEEFIEDTISSVDSDKIESAVKDSLEEVGAKTIEEIPAEKKTEFVQSVEEKLQQYAPDIDTVSDKLTVDKASEAIAELKNGNVEAATSGTKLPEPQKEFATSAVIIIIVAAIIVAVITTIAVCVKKKDKKRGGFEV